MKRFALISLLILSLGLVYALSCYDVQFTETPGTDGLYASPYTGQTVTLSNVIVSAVGYGTSSSFPQPKFFVTDPAGGPWSGLYVYRFGTGVQVGDMVNITGGIIEYFGMTEVAGTNPTPTIQIVSSGNPVPEPALIQTNVMSNPANPAIAEMWESCLVKVEGVTVTATPNSYNEFYVTDGSGAGQIDNSNYIYSHAWTGITVGQQWARIVGILDYSYDIYGLCPRGDTDMYTTANEDYIVLPQAQLIGNYPNPFVGQTEIAFNLKSVQPVQIDVFNLKGQKVRTLVNGKMSAQLHNVTFDGKDDRGNLLPSGVYMYKMTAGSNVQSRKLVIR
jgi:hypothetical protein